MSINFSVRLSRGTRSDYNTVIMSGHSHYATTHRQKEIKDAARGQVFSKLSRAITIAAKTGGGPDPDSNYKLRIAIEKARTVSMPKENIDRAISKAESSGELEEVRYEGFGPEGILVLVDATTDNRNRTNSEIRNLFDKNGGKMGNPGSVSFNFEPKGYLSVKKAQNFDEQMLSLIDAGAEDIIETPTSVEIYVAPHELSDVAGKLTEKGLEVLSSELAEKPKNFQEIGDRERLVKFIQNLESHDDVQKVYTNANF